MLGPEKRPSKVASSICVATETTNAVVNDDSLITSAEYEFGDSINNVSVAEIANQITKPPDNLTSQLYLWFDLGQYIIESTEATTA